MFHRVYGAVVFISLLQGCSHQYGWPGFNQTTFRGNNHISANILEFGGMPGGPVGSHMATVGWVDISGCKLFESDAS